MLTIYDRHDRKHRADTNEARRKWTAFTCRTPENAVDNR